MSMSRTYESVKNAFLKVAKSHYFNEIMYSHLNDDFYICFEWVYKTSMNLNTESNEIHTLDVRNGECLFTDQSSISVLCIKFAKSYNNVCDFYLESRSDRLL